MNAAASDVRTEERAAEGADRGERLRRIAGALLATGLLVEAGTLYWKSPTSFLVFAMAGASLVVIGIVIYLYSLLV